MVYYIQCIRNGVTCYMTYEGQTLDTVNMLLSNLGAISVQFITEDAWNTANPPLVL